ncbi:MAG TPA: hypothetical protein VMP01_01720 [Pirellulaceae bacterium]|nr:hypothetical protein [Pirellulaceae bacterium]
MAAPQKAEKKKPEEAEAPEVPPRPLAVPKRPGPLRGGTGKPSGGDQFGLRW